MRSIHLGALPSRGVRIMSRASIKHVKPERGFIRGLFEGRASSLSPHYRIMIIESDHVPSSVCFAGAVCDRRRATGRSTMTQLWSTASSWGESFRCSRRTT